MTLTIAASLNSLNPGPPQSQRSETLQARAPVVTEATRDGTAPEPKVTNGGAPPVLLPDGEAPAGARRNRVLHAAALVPERRSLVIPVHRTEQERRACRVE